MQMQEVFEDPKKHRKNLTTTPPQNVVERNWKRLKAAFDGMK